MTVMFLVLSLLPIIGVRNPLIFTAKVGGFTLVCQLVAMGLFYSHQLRKRAAAAKNVDLALQPNVY